MSRRRLPAPPLVLRPIFLRVTEGTAEAQQLVELAQFLQGQAMLTGGGESKLKLGLTGLGRQCSLTLQDVRSWAHGLVEELISCLANPERWPEKKQRYLSTYDRGKPRRPTHIQRLYQRWSSDLDWTGLIAAAQRHPRIWSDIEHAVSFLETPSQEKHILELALHLKHSQDWSVWKRQFEQNGEYQRAYLRLLPLTGQATLQQRVDWLEDFLSRKPAEKNLRIPFVLCALKHRGEPIFKGSCPSLFSLNIETIEETSGRVEPLLLYALLTTLNRPDSLPILQELVAPTDPILSIGYGARPGVNWTEQLWERLSAKLD